MKVNIENIDPKRAEELLAQNHNNRKLRKKTVTKYAKALERGQWDSTGEPFQVSRTGRLMNGQHRAAAIVESGIPMENVVVVSGLDDAVFINIDTGFSRKPSDALQAVGATNASQMGATVKLLIGLELNLQLTNSHEMSLITREDLVTWYTPRRDELEQALSDGRKLNAAIGGKMTAWQAFCYMATDRYGQLVLDDFLQPLVTGVGHIEGDSRITLQRWIINPHNSALPAYQHLQAAIKTFVAHCGNSPHFKKIHQWNTSQPFPEIV
jgi:hypothetical protein